MRQLTPAEVREIEAIKRTIQNCDYIIFTSKYDANVNIAMADGNQELWLNILDLALQQIESLKMEWISNG